MCVYVRLEGLVVVSDVVVVVVAGVYEVAITSAEIQSKHYYILTHNDIYINN